jgi:hypothetical protein
LIGERFGLPRRPGGDGRRIPNTMEKKIWRENSAGY